MWGLNRDIKFAIEHILWKQYTWTVTCHHQRSSLKKPQSIQSTTEVVQWSQAIRQQHGSKLQESCWFHDGPEDGTSGWGVKEWCPHRATWPIDWALVSPCIGLNMQYIFESIYTYIRNVNLFKPMKPNGGWSLACFFSTYSHGNSWLWRWWRRLASRAYRLQPPGPFHHIKNKCSKVQVQNDLYRNIFWNTSSAPTLLSWSWVRPVLKHHQSVLWMFQAGPFVST